MNPAKRRAIFERLRSLNPQPKSELEFSTPYQLLVAVVLSAQATDRSVNVATRELFKVAPTPPKMVALGEERLIGYIKTIGLFRTKAANVMALSRLLERHAPAVRNQWRQRARGVVTGCRERINRSERTHRDFARGEPRYERDADLPVEANRLKDDRQRPAEGPGDAVFNRRSRSSGRWRRKTREEPQQDRQREDDAADSSHG